MHGFKVGDKVYFGRTKGQQTLGEIVKLNGTKAKVQTLETRGNRAGHGEVWTVPYGMMRLATGEESRVAPVPEVKPLTFFAFDKFNMYYKCILAVYGGLSPENLTADGERPRGQINALAREYQRQLRHLFAIVGREITESEIYAWNDGKADDRGK